MLTILIIIPLICSIVGYLYNIFFQERNTFPGSSLTHKILIISQIFVVNALLIFPSSNLPTLMCTLLYTSQGIGVIYFFKKKGNANCSCFGSHLNGKLGWKLVLFNFTFSFLSYLSLSSPIKIDFYQGIFLNAMLGCLGLLIISGIPDAVRILKTLPSN